MAERYAKGLLYREHSPPIRLAPYIECFWTQESGLEHRVLPDACEDIVYIPATGSLTAVGAMTCAQLYTHAGGQTITGVRFRPSMARAFLNVPANLLTDRLIALADLWGSRGERLRRGLTGVEHPREAIAILANELRPQHETPLQPLTTWVVEHGGQVRTDDLARFAGLSPRQMRRVFLEQTGLSPKMFCRVVRFRNLISQLRPGRRVGWAEQALDSGYYDQSHLVNEFREFSGLTPGEYAPSL